MNTADRTARLTLLFLFGDLLLTELGLYLALQLRLWLPFGQDLGPGGETLPSEVYLLAMACWGGAFLATGIYDSQRVLGNLTSWTRLIPSAGMGTLLFAGGLYFTFRQVSRLLFVYFFFISLGLLILLRLSVRMLLNSRRAASAIYATRVLIVGSGDLARQVAATLQEQRIYGYNLIGFLDNPESTPGSPPADFPLLGTLDALEPTIEAYQVQEVWSTLPPDEHDQLHELVYRLEGLPVRVKVIPDYFSLALVQARTQMLGGIPLIGLREPLIQGTPRMIKRTFDVVTSLSLLLLLSPLLGLIALLVKSDSPGPVLFRHMRVGENMRLFEMLKFRTMVADAEEKRLEVLRYTEQGEVLHKHPDDPRLTRIGRFLRRYSLDELPQLINVLSGDMSLVGPRPEMPWLVDRYQSWQRKRFAVPQGITGWWQINERSDKPMHLNTEEDLFYVYNYSLWLDVKILLRTPLAVLRGRGAY